MSSRLALRLASAVFLLCLGLNSALGQQAGGTRRDADLPPILGTCPMHPDVVDDHRGTCPICKMALVPIRLALVWTCPVHGVIEQDRPGKCRICSRDLVQTTRSVTFTCSGQPEAGQPTVEHPCWVVDLAVADQMDDSREIGHETPAAAAARAAARAAAATLSTTSSSCRAPTNHASNAEGGRCTPWSSIAWSITQNANLSTA